MVEDKYVARRQDCAAECDADCGQICWPNSGRVLVACDRYVCEARQSPGSMLTAALGTSFVITKKVRRRAFPNPFSLHSPSAASRASRTTWLMVCA